MNAIKIDTTLLQIGSTEFSVGDLLIIAACLLLTLLLIFIFAIWKGSKNRQKEAEFQKIRAEDRAREAEQRMAELIAAQNDLAGRLSAVQENVSANQSAFSKQLDERLANVSGRVSQSLADTTKSTQESLGKLQERLAVIDSAQTNIQSLAQDVVGLQNILQNKQTRGAFGQSRMEAIVQDGLPMGTFEFQASLSNKTRPDCLIHMPNDAPALVVDSKFPLESWNAYRDAEHDQIEKENSGKFKRDMEVHIKDIASKYLIPGETQETAFLFVPSESIFADLHEKFEPIVQKAHKSRIVLVSPSLLLLSIQVIQAIMKDARMREQAHLIQSEVMKFVDDLSRLDDRVRKLQSHFNQTTKDVDNILISTDKLSKRGRKIGDFDIGEDAGSKIDNQEATGKPFLRAIELGD